MRRRCELHTHFSLSVFWIRATKRASISIFTLHLHSSASVLLLLVHFVYRRPRAKPYKPVETVTREKTSPAKTNVFPRRHSFVLFFSSLHIGIAAAEPERIQIARNCYTREIEPRRNRCLSRPRVRFPFLGPNASLFAAPFCLLLISNGYIARRGQKDTNRSKLLHARRNASAETDVLSAVPPISPFTLPSCSSPDF